MPQRIFDLLAYYTTHYGHKDCLFAHKEKGVWVKCSGQWVIETTDAVSMALIQMGVQKGDRVALMIDSGPQWNVIDFGIQQLGAIVVPIHLNIGRDGLAHILSHCHPKAIFVRDGSLIRHTLDIIRPIIPQDRIISMAPAEDFLPFDTFLRTGQNRPDLREALEKAEGEVLPDDTASIIYTSGTSGVPKGVMLSHGNIMSNIAHYVNDVPRIDRSVSHLPLSHIFERSVQYARIYCGIEICYAESKASIVRDVIELKANSFSTVPRVLERMYDYVVQKGETLKGVKKRLFQWAVRLADNFDETGKHSNALYRCKMALADHWVYKDIREMFGGNLVFINSGGALLHPHLVKFFTAIGIPVGIGYGLTETSPTISSTRLTQGLVKAGAVGHPCRNLDVKIDEATNEILVKGPSVMKGYFMDEEKTRLAFDEEGYFHTGDKGWIDSDGFLFLTGRIKDIFKTSMGKYIVPEAIENKLCESAYISNAMVTGEGQRFAAALVVPDFQQLKLWCRQQGITFCSVEEMLGDKRVQKLIEDDVSACNNTLGSTERVQRIRLLDHEWTVESGELTPSFKIRRNVIQENNKELIKSLFD
ncbi:MAG: long-chain fatty acid--CoA ligase [Bacteroidales bacterium]|nr:long-chain fatty acid--CoA ligase [Bacteroidales bacterium]